jgi:flagellar hook-basal body complex protein FliE
MADPIGGIGNRLSHAITGGGLDTGAKQVPVLQDSGTKGTSFGDTLKNAIDNVQQTQDTAADYAARFTRGEPVELHQVMASAEEASITLEMLVQVRNKFMDAYKTVMTMQS